MNIARILGLGEPTEKEISLDLITLDERCQCRDRMVEHVIDDYARAIKDGDKLPPLEVVHDPAAGLYYCSDGWHRAMALRRAQIGKWPCIVYEGTIKDAVRLALRANTQHGLRRSQGEVKTAITKALTEFPEWSDNQIAKWVGAAHPYVGRVRTDMGAVAAKQERLVTRTKDGKTQTYTQKVREAKPKPAPVDPPVLSCHSDKIEPAPTVPASPVEKLAPAVKGTSDAERTDRMGWVGPHRVAGVFTQSRDEGLEVVKTIAHARKLLLDKGERNVIGLQALGINRVQVHAESLKTIGKAIQDALPHAVCPYCNGRGEGCTSCQHRGWLSKREWDLADADLKHERETAIARKKEQA